MRKIAVFASVMLLLFASCSGELNNRVTILDTTAKGSDEDIVDFLSRSGYTITWQDEFEGTSLNQDYWKYEVGNGSNGWGNWESQYYSQFPSEVYLEDGALHIVANKKSNGQWMSGRIKTQRKMQFQYGYIEAEVVLPTGESGMWPAFWLLGCTEDGSISWPTTGEFDIMEYSPATQGARRVYSTLHTATNNGGNGLGLGDYTFSEDQNADDYIFKPHRFGLLWTPKYIEVYYDGRLIGRQEKPSEASYERWPFDDQAFVILNLAVGGQLGGKVPDTATCYEYVVNYVRLYQEVERVYL